MIVRKSPAYINKFLAECAKVNMLGWNNFPSSMVGGYHEGSNEIMLALYKLNEVLFNATVVYPLMIYNQEAQRYEYKDNAFMTFNPSHKNRHDKPFGDSGFYRSNIVNISEYFDKYTTLNKESILEKNDNELWLFTMYLDFMSHIAQQLERYRDHGQSLKSARLPLCEVVNVCQTFQRHDTYVMKKVMHAIIAESYPTTHFVKDYTSDFQVRKAMTWEDFMTGEKVSNIEQLRQILVNKIEPNELDTDAYHLRRGDNMIQGMMSNKKRRENLEPMSFPRTTRVREGTINEQLDAEN